ncbi:MAG TPA: hypothetical protein PLS28_00400, partial [Clostridiales bacterium]|nr:hypothetical protein [Clostridiales bacterium]
SIIATPYVVEITTFRKDGTYRDNRHPEQVFFTDRPEEDLARRDFTVNAMAYGKEGELIDLFGGQSDLETKQIRCVGNPDVRFQEDALRILRALRFASVLNFQISPETAASLRRNTERIPAVSAERITAELRSFLIGPGAGRLLREFPQVFSTVMPGVNPTAEVCRAVDRATKNFSVRMALLLDPVLPPSEGDSAEKDILKESAEGGAEKDMLKESAKDSAEDAFSFSLSHLRLTSKEKETILSILKHRSLPPFSDAVSARKALFRIGPEQLPLLLDFFSAKGRSVAKEQACLKTVIEQKDCYEIGMLSIDGNRLQQLGCPSGPAVGQLLEILLLQVMEEKTENTRSALEKAALKEIQNGTSQD